MYTRQRGITFIGWLLLLAPLAVVFYTGVRLTPIYLNYLKVVHSLDALKSDYNADDPSTQHLVNALQRQFDVQSVDFPTTKDIAFTRAGRGWVVDASYDDQAPLFANISIQVQFHKAVELGSSGSN
jgi:hypothetical protein